MPRKRRQMGGIDRLPSGRYRVRIVEPGTGRRVSVGTYRTKGDAEQEYAKALTDQGRGAWVPPDRGRVTLREYAPRWLAARLTVRGEPLRPRVIELYESELRLHILPVLGDVPLGLLSKATVRSWHADLLAKGPGASTTAKCYRLLRAMLNTAVEDGLIVTNPCTIKGAGVESSDERAVPTVSQVEALAAKVDPRFKALVLLAAYAGLRRGELFGLTRRHVDLKRQIVTVAIQRQQSAKGEELIGPPKTDAGRRPVTIPLAALPALKEHLERWVEPGPDARVFTGVKGGSLRPHVWQKQWADARAAFGLDDLHFHDLRHVAGTLAAATGAGTKELMHRLGHVSSQAALRYQHATPDRDRAIADGMDRLIEAARKKEQPAPVRHLRSVAEPPGA
jgi:integrase